MNPRPIIGITTYARNESRNFTLPMEYVDAVRRAGGLPVLLPPGEPHLETLLDLLDGVILSGGGDINPAMYEGNDHETIYMVDHERDQSEIELARKLLDLDLPTLCICRGIQVLNVALGGTLIEHLPDEVGEEIAHRLPPRNPTQHAIWIEPDSRLADIIGSTEVTATSWHHQAIRRLAAGLKVVAQAPDGTIEAVEMATHPWLVAVQWHPELTAADDPSQQRLFDALVAAVIRNQSG